MGANVSCWAAAVVIKVRSFALSVRICDRRTWYNLKGYGGIWEWYDGAVERRDVKMVQAVIAASKVTLRYNGKQYYDDREITTAEKQALQNVLDAFVALGGNLDNP